MRCCSVKHCKHLKLDPHTRVYKFPPFDKGHEELKRRRFWMKFTNRPLTMWKPSPGSGICANHFRKKFITIGARNTKLEQTAIPTFPVGDDGLVTDREIFLEVYEDNPEIPYGSVPKNLPSHYISDGASKQIRASRKLLTSVLSKSKEQQIQTDESQDPLKGLASDPLNFLTKVLSQHMTPAGDNDQELNKLSNCCRACLDDFGTNDLNCVFEGESLTDTFFNCTSIKVDQGDKLPQFICDLCFEQLKYAKQLRNNSLKSDKILKNDMPAFATFTIKAEPVEEQPIDDSIEYPQLDLIVKFEAELPTIQEPIISCDQQENVSEIMYTDICDANSNEVLEKAVDEEEDSDGLGDLVIPPKRIKIRRRKSQHVVKSWDCSFCEETFNCNKKFWKHIEEHKLAKEKTPFDCTNCGRGFFVESVFKNHKCISKLRCQICDTNFESFKNLLAHLRNLHLEDKKCEKCNIELQSARHLHYHIRDHDKLLAYNCEMCGKLFKNRKAILSHINKSHRKMPDFSCDLCGSQIKNKSTLRHHMDSIHLKQQCLCPHCARTFKSNDTLNMHLIQRHGAPPAVTCTKCKKGFLYVSQLNLHNLQKHLGERNKTAQQMDENDPRIIKCGVCRRKFLRLENLRRHQAEYCGEVTTGGTRQINRKVFKYKCRFCFKSFKFTNQCQEHERKHTKEKPYICKFCGRRLMSSGTLRKHLKVVHKKKQPYVSSQPNYKPGDVEASQENLEDN